MPKASANAKTATVALEKIVPDTSVLAGAVLSARIKNGELKVKEIIVHEAALAELEHQANEARTSGQVGLDELIQLQAMAAKGLFELRFGGRRPNVGEIRMAKLGEIDALIRQLAWEEGATLVTGDRVQASAGEAKGIHVLYLPSAEVKGELQLEKFFDAQTMSVHLREGVTPMAKKGKPGDWDFVTVRKQTLTANEIQEIAKEIMDHARARHDSFVEIERASSTIVQLGRYRIVILKPPFSDGWEITAVRPVKRLTFDDYKLSDKLRSRIERQAEGVLIAGAPGHGKTTFATALALNYAAQEKIVKTVEAPRDLVLPEEVTQLAISKATPEEVHDILLLTRPDYTIFDEMRNTPDFSLYADLRLAGVGMVGVIHATDPFDAIQRFIGRIELGVIPHVIDTVLFIKNGAVAKVLAIKMEVKVPSGMTEADLARPVVVVSDFESERPLAEIYSYGEETVVVPVEAGKKIERGARGIAVQVIERAVQRFADHVHVEMPSEDKAVVYVPERNVAAVIGREGRNVQSLEKQLGLSIDVRSMEDVPKSPHPTGKQVPHDLVQTSKYYEIYFGTSLVGNDVDLFIGDDYLASFAVGKKGLVRIKKTNKLGKTLEKALHGGEKLKVFSPS